MPVPESKTADLGFGTPRDLGFMLYDIDHAADRAALFFRATLDRGVMRVLPPNSREIHR
jgi:CRISPR-associated protein Cas5d